MRLWGVDAELLDEFSGVAGVDADLRLNAAMNFTNRQACGQYDFDGFPRVLACVQVPWPDRS
jgi:hypothetical protein